MASEPLSTGLSYLIVGDMGRTMNAKWGRVGNLPFEAFAISFGLFL